MEPKELPNTCRDASNVFQWTWQHTCLALITENILARRNKGAEFRPYFPVHFSFPLCPILPLSYFLFHQYCGGLFNFPSFSYHGLWVGRIFHTAFGFRSVKHLGQRMKYRTSTERQAQPPAAIPSEAILIAGAAVWVIPSVVHHGAKSFFSAQ